MKISNTSKRLKEIMINQNLKQIDILKKSIIYCKEYDIKLNKSDLSQFVSGKVEPGSFKLTVLAKALNVSETWLMGYNVPMERERNDDFTDVSQSVTDITSDEFEIIKKYRSLNEEGQEKATDYIFDLVDTGKYKKHGESLVGEETAKQA